MPATNNRRLKAIAKLVLHMCIIFFGTVLVSACVFVLTTMPGKILSPVTKAQSTESSGLSEVKTFCQNNHLSCQSITAIDDGAIQINFPSGVVFLSGKKDIGKQLASLQKIVEQLTIKGKQFKKLDFRFDSIVVSF